jgi:hypothetical protein
LELTTGRDVEGEFQTGGITWAKSIRRQNNSRLEQLKGQEKGREMNH